MAEKRSDLLSEMISDRFIEESFEGYGDSVMFQKVNLQQVERFSLDNSINSGIVSSEFKIILIVPESHCEICLDSILLELNSYENSELINGYVLNSNRQNQRSIFNSIRYSGLDWTLYNCESSINIEHALRKDYPYLMLLSESNFVLSVCIPVEGNISVIRQWLNKIANVFRDNY